MIMKIEQFNCSGTNNQSSEFALSPPYNCCGWAYPPGSFTGRYKCISNPISNQYGCNAGWIGFTLPITDFCSVSNGFRYQDPNFPNEGSIPITIGLFLTICLDPNGSVPPGPNGFSVGFLDFISINGTFTCNKKQFYFYGSGSSSGNDGSFYTVDVEITSNQ